MGVLFPVCFVMMFLFNTAVSLPVLVLSSMDSVESGSNSTQFQPSAKSSHAKDFTNISGLDSLRYYFAAKDGRQIWSNVPPMTSSSVRKQSRHQKRARRVKRHHPVQPLNNLAGSKTAYALVPVKTANGGSKYLLLKNLKFVVDNKNNKNNPTLSPAFNKPPYPPSRFTPRAPLPEQTRTSVAMKSTKAPGKAKGNPWVIRRVVDKGSIRIERMTTPVPVVSKNPLQTNRRQTSITAGPDLDIPVNRAPKGSFPSRNRPRQSAGGANKGPDIALSKASDPFSRGNTRVRKLKGVSIARSSNPFTRGRPRKQMVLNVPYRGTTGRSPGRKVNVFVIGSTLPRKIVDSMKTSRRRVSPPPSTKTNLVGAMTPKANALTPTTKVALVGAMTPKAGGNTAPPVGVSKSTRPPGSMSKTSKQSKTKSSVTTSLNNRAARVTRKQTVSIKVKPVKTVVESGPVKSTIKPATSSSPTAPPIKTLVTTPASTTTPLVTTPASTTTPIPETTPYATEPPEEVPPTTEEPEEPLPTTEQGEMEEFLVSTASSNVAAAVTPVKVVLELEQSSQEVTTSGRAGHVAGWAAPTTEPSLGPSDRINTTDVPEEIEPKHRLNNNKANSKSQVATTMSLPVETVTKVLRKRKQSITGNQKTSKKVMTVLYAVLDNVFGIPVYHKYH